MTNSTTPITFNDFNISPPFKQLIAKAGFVTPTPIQVKAIPPALEGRDIIGAAQTGTGKTAAFVIPIVEQLRGRKGLGALILTPTRELALQIEEVFSQFARGQLRVTSIIGGASMGLQRRILQQQPNVIVATPGRLLDHLGQQTIDLRPLKILILDEADRMLDMGFKPQIDRILAAVPKERQTMLFSATIPAEISAMSRAELRNPVRVEIARIGMTAEKVSQGIFRVGQMQKMPLLIWLLEQQTGPTLVFTKTKHRADRVARTLQMRGFTVTVLHANRSLGQRKTALEGFKRGTFRVLVATDIAARGIDVIDIEHVVNFDLPHVAEDYVHRVGRTARAERSGHAWSFASQEEGGQLRDIERLLRKSIPLVSLPEGLPAPEPMAFVPRPQQRMGGQRMGGRFPQRPAARPSFGARGRGEVPQRPQAITPRQPQRSQSQRPHSPRPVGVPEWTPTGGGDSFFVQKVPRRMPRFGGGRSQGQGGRSQGGFRRGGGRPHGQHLRAR